MTNLTNEEELEKLCPRPWRYQTAEETDSFAKWGENVLYAGGGYVANLGYNIDTANDVVDSLEFREWLDRKTRVVMLEFAFFNPTTNILSVSTYFYELFPTGGATAFTGTKTLSLYSQDTGIYQFYRICQLLFIFLTLFYLVRECFKLFRQRLSFFKSPWNWLELTQILVAILAVVFYVVKVNETTKTIRELQENVYANVSFDAAILWTEVENGVLAVLTFIVSLKLLRIVRFNRHISVFSATLYLGLKRLLSFVLVLLIAFVAFLHYGILTFGQSVPRYSTLKKAVYFQLELILGKVKARPINELTASHDYAGRLFSSAFLLSLTIVFMNFFVAVINDSLEEVQHAKDESEKERDTTQITLVEKAQGNSSKLDFGRISKAIKRIKPRISPENKEGDSNCKPCNKPCNNRSGRHIIDFEFVSVALMIALRKKDNVDLKPASTKKDSAVNKSTQRKLDFANISETIKRIHNCKESTSTSDAETTSTARRNSRKNCKRRVRFANTELQRQYIDLEKKQSNLFELIEKILDRSNDEERIFEFFLKEYAKN